jgi:phosphoglycolate phosphatase-like HAD superfamily hydrolase
MSQSTTPLIIYALDFDGVLVDSASETGNSGLKAAKILWPEATWLQELETNDSKKQPIIDRFRQVRPCLETGWEAALIIKLLADPSEGQPSNEDILQDFPHKYKPALLQKLGLSKDDLNTALKTARNEWIAANNGQDWIDAHGFFEGAVQAVQTLLQTDGNENVYVITTKAKDYAIRLMEQRQLFGGENGRIKEDHVYGLGSGSKPDVLAKILKERKADMAVMVEDNLLTLRKILSSELQNKVLPALASWGYNTTEQQEAARNDHYVVLDKGDSSSISKVLKDDSVKSLFDEFRNQRATMNDN